MIQKRIPGTFVETTIAGKCIRFFVHDPSDLIQRHHFAGEFYEQEELALMSHYMRPDTRYLDIGANIGNHVIFFSKIIGLKNTVVIEPNGQAMVMLQLNLVLNEIQNEVDGSCLGYGLSDRIEKADMVLPVIGNLGAARFVPAPDGPFRLTTGDALLGERAFDFIKIDTEGMELRCLHGLAKLIARCRPTMFVEVDNANQGEFFHWCQEHGYLVRERFRRHTECENYLVTPS